MRGKAGRGGGEGKAGRGGGGEGEGREMGERISADCRTRDHIISGHTPIKMQEAL